MVLMLFWCLIIAFWLFYYVIQLKDVHFKVKNGVKRLETKYVVYINKLFRK